MESKRKIDFKKIGLCLLYPHIAVIICLLPISIAFLICSLVFLDNESIISLLSYLLAFYVLLVICFRMPKIIKFFKTFYKENKYVQRWINDVHLRMNVSLYGSLVWNITFALFQLGLGIYHNSFWFYAMFVYYVMLALMRFFLAKHTKKYKANEEAIIENKKSILCGYLLIAMNLALGVIVFFMVYLNKTFYHHQITTIAIAAYTFFTFISAIVNFVKYRKYNSPVYSSAKIITLIAGAVSMLTLESTMLTTFGGDDNPMFGRIMLSLTGAVIIVFTVVMGLIMIVKGTKRIKEFSMISKNDCE
ncbi:MAG: hypothetical protein ACI4U5_00315 [Bacilli bacterium]